MWQLRSFVLYQIEMRKLKTMIYANENSTADFYNATTRNEIFNKVCIYEYLLRLKSFYLLQILVEGKKL